MCNEKLRECGIDATIDRKSLAEQGRENEIPTVHLGHEANLMKLRAERLEREGKAPNQTRKPKKEILSDNIKEYNAAVQTSQKIEKAVQVKIAEIKVKLDDIKQKKTLLVKEKNALLPELSRLQKLADEELSEEERAKESLEMIEKINKNALGIISALENELASCSIIEIDKKKKLIKEIENEKQKIADRDAYQSSVTKKAGNIPSLQKYQELQKMSDDIQKEIDALDTGYQNILDSIPKELKGKMAITEPAKPKGLSHSK